jgi:hypothetical protein
MDDAFDFPYAALFEKWLLAMDDFRAAAFHYFDSFVVRNFGVTPSDSNTAPMRSC